MWCFSFFFLFPTGNERTSVGFNKEGCGVGGVLLGRWAPRRSRTCLSLGDGCRFPLAVLVLPGSAPLPVAILFHSGVCDVAASLSVAPLIFFCTLFPLFRFAGVLWIGRNVSRHSVKFSLYIYIYLFIYIYIFTRCFVAIHTGSSVEGVVFPPRPPPSDAGGGGFLKINRKGNQPVVGCYLGSSTVSSFLTYHSLSVIYSRK